MFPGRFTESIFELVAAHFPMQVDFYEEDEVVHFFEFVRKTLPWVFLRGAERVLRGYAKRLVVQEFDEDILQLMRTHVQFVQMQDAAQFAMLVQSMTQSEQEEIQNLIQNWAVCWNSNFLLLFFLFLFSCALPAPVSLDERAAGRNCHQRSHREQGTRVA